MMVQSGAAVVVIAGGVESERSRPVERFGKISGMIETAENLARDWGIAREEADAYAARSHARAAAAWAASTPKSLPCRCRSARAIRSRSPATRAFAPAPRRHCRKPGPLRVLMPGGTVTAASETTPVPPA